MKERGTGRIYRPKGRNAMFRRYNIVTPTDLLDGLRKRREYVEGAATSNVKRFSR